MKSYSFCLVMSLLACNVEARELGLITNDDGQTVLTDVNCPNSFGLITYHYNSDHVFTNAGCYEYNNANQTIVITWQDKGKVNYAITDVYPIVSKLYEPQEL